MTAPLGHPGAPALAPSPSLRSDQLHLARPPPHSQLGGLAAYQAVSLRSEAAGSTNTSRWVVKQLQKLRLHQPEARRHFLQTGSASAAATAAAAAGAPEPTQLPATAAHAPQGAALPDAQRLRLLDVGALAENYKAEAGWIRARAIDLNSQTPAVARADFFDEPLQPPLDVLSLCLVMNFVGDPKRAGQMLWKAAAHLRRGGLLAVMVPRACVDNSRYCTDALFQQALQHVGFAVVTVDHSARLARYMARRVDDGGGGGGGGGGGDGGGDAELPGALSKRTVVRSGGQRNNFCVLLTPKWTAEEGSRQATA